MSLLWRDSPEHPSCGHWIGVERRYCLAGDGLRSCLTGLRCPLHTPAALTALAGRSEPRPGPGPGLPAGAWTTPSPQSASALIDERAVASGKRRASPSAQAARRPQRE